MTLTLAADTFSHYGPVFVLMAMALIFSLAVLVLSRLFGHSRQGPVKGMVYESGMNPIGTAERRFNVRFYVVAMSFLVFDVEIVFLYPWAVAFDQLPLFVFLAMMLFLFNLTVPYVYEWRRGGLDWD